MLVLSLCHYFQLPFWFNFLAISPSPFEDCWNLIETFDVRGDLNFGIDTPYPDCDHPDINCIPILGSMSAGIQIASLEKKRRIWKRPPMNEDALNQLENTI